MFEKRSSTGDRQEGLDSETDSVGTAGKGKAKPRVQTFVRTNKFKMISVFVAAVMLLICIAPAVSFGIDPKAPPQVSAEEEDEEEDDGPIYDPYDDFDQLAEVPEGWIGIYTIEDLAKIGIDANYPLNGDYIQMADLDFTKASSSYLSALGFEIKITATVESTRITFLTQYRANGSTGAWIDISGTYAYSFDKTGYSTATNATVTIDNSQSGYGTDGYQDLIYTVGGNISVVGDFVMAIEIPRGLTTGTVVKESYQLGNFKPIGDNSTNTDATRFSGNYDGNSYLIAGLETASYSTSKQIFVGLFGYSTGLVKNLGMVQTQNGSKGIWGMQALVGSGDVGGIVGNMPGWISNCYNTCAVSSISSNSNSEAGGLAGSSGGPIFNSYNTGTVYSTGYQALVGGIVGYMALSATSANDCYNLGSIVSISTTSSAYAGGIIGRGVIANRCYNEGSIVSHAITSTADTCAGGIAGYISTVTDSYNLGSVTTSTPGSSSTVYAGGIAGRLFSSLTNCYTVGSVAASSGLNAYKGGLAGQNDNGTITFSFYLDTVASSGIGTGKYGGLPFDANQLRTQTTFTDRGWDFDTVWMMSPDLNDGLPILRSMSPYSVNIVIQPESQIKDIGEQASFYTEATALGDVFYRWEFSVDGTTWASVGSGALLRVTTTAETIGMYRCAVSSPASGMPVYTNVVTLSLVTQYISSIDDLTKIGNDPSYPLDGNYVQTNDIDFSQASPEYLATLGYEVRVTATINSTQIVFQIQYRTNGSTGAWTDAANTSLTYSFGMIMPTTAETDASGQYTIPNASSGYGTTGYADLIFAVAGTMNGGTFAFSLEIPTGVTSGTVTKESYRSGNFTPIGNRSTPFTGKYNGNNYMIKGLETAIYTAGEASAGLFYWVSEGEISNIGIVAVDNGTKGIWGSQTAFSSSSSSTSSAFAGGIAGLSSVPITNCYNTGSVSGSSTFNAFPGGIVGYIQYSTITDCYNTGTISGSSSSSVAQAGGIAGSSPSSLITNCYNTGSVSGSSLIYSELGGIAGSSSSSSPSSIANCYNTGNVSASSSSDVYAGGIAGSSSSSIANCYNTGTVYASSLGTRAFIGGIAGSSSSSIANCYNTGAISGSASSDAFLGGIAGNSISTISDSYFLDTSASSGVGRGTEGGTSKTESELKQQSTFTNWDFTDVWAISTAINDGYPYLQKAQPNTITIMLHPESKIGNSGDEVTFNAEAVAYPNPDLTYTWQFSRDNGYTWKDVGSGEAFRVTVSSATVGAYRCMISSPMTPSVYTDTATLSFITNEITTVEDLAKIGYDPAYPMDGNYVMGNDIDFGDWNSYFGSNEAEKRASMESYLKSRGYLMRVTPTVGGLGSGDSVSFKLEYSTDGTAWQPMTGSIVYFFGSSAVQDTALDGTGSFSVLNSDSGYDGSFALTLMVGGTLDSKDFSFSMELAVGSAGQRTAKISYFLGNFTPIGYNTSTKGYTFFRGSFDGRGFKIIGMETAVIAFSSTNIQCAGLFSFLGAIAVVKGVGIEGGGQTAINLSGSGVRQAFAGGIAGGSMLAKVSDCHNTGYVSSGSHGAYAGGIIGDSAAFISNCYNTGSVTASGLSNEGTAGGIIGYSSESVENSYNAGNVVSSSSSQSYNSTTSGGIVGYSSATVTNCYNIGYIILIAGGQYSQGSGGGIVGFLYVSTIYNCYNTGSIFISTSSKAYSGGIVGNSPYNSSYVFNCYNTGSVSSSTTLATSYSYSGGIVGSISGSTISSSNVLDCYNMGSIHAASGYHAYSGGIIGSASYLLLSNCYSSGSVSASVPSSYGAFKGGIAGDIGYNIGSVLNSLYESGKGSTAAWGSGTPSDSTGTPAPGLDTSGMKTLSTYTGRGWDFTDTWAITTDGTINNGYPYLGFMNEFILITMQPVNQNKDVGETANFITEATSTSPVSYQWQISTDDGATWSNISGATSSLYSFVVSSSDVSGTRYRAALTTTGNSAPLYTDVVTFNLRTEIRTIQDLEKIGNDPEYRLDGYYVQMENIDFTTPEAKAYLDSVRGYMVCVTPTIKGLGTDDGITFKVEYSTDGGKSWSNMTGNVTYSFGKILMKTATLDTDGSFEVLNSDSRYDGTENITLILGGEFTPPGDKGSKFAFSMDVAKGKEGERDSKASYHLGNFTPIGFDPIANTYLEFTGSFNGNGYKIIGLETAGFGVVRHNGSSIQSTGLFSHLGLDAIVTRVGLQGGSLTVVSTTSSYVYAGGIVGYSFGATVSDSYNNGSVNITSSADRIHSGGIAGYLYGSNVSECYSTSSVTVTGTKYTHAGGIVGREEMSSVIGCYNAGYILSITSSEANVGGIAGHLSSTGAVKGSSNGGNVVALSTKVAYAGGIVGFTSSYGTEITFCSNSGKVSGNGESAAYAGGIAGLSQGGIFTDLYNIGQVISKADASDQSRSTAGGLIGSLGFTGIIRNCYSAGPVSASSSTSTLVYIGGIAGSVGNQCRVMNSVYESGKGSTAAWGAGTPLDNTGTPEGGFAASAMKALYTYTSRGWDFINTWAIATDGSVNSGYPYLQAFASAGVTIVKHPQDAIADVGEEAVFEAEATSTETLTYRWEFSSDGGNTWTTIGFGEKLKFKVTSESAGLYRCAISAPPISEPVYTNSAQLKMPIVIEDIEDLEKIGNDPSYPLDGNYVQTDDIDFTEASPEYLATLGYEVRVAATINSTQIVFQIQYRANGSTGAWTNAANTSLAYSFGKVIHGTANTNASGQLTILNALSGYGTADYADLIFTVGGTMNGGTFAFSLEIPVGLTSGTVSKESYQYGNFTPIGSGSAPFTGKYNGKNFTIRGLETAVYSSTGNAYAGLFGYADGAEISNLGVVAAQNGSKGEWGAQTTVNRSGEAFSGGIAGYASSSSSISNSYNTGSISASASNNAYSGGIAGQSPSILNCYNTGSISASASAIAYSGGIAGSASSSITNCYNTGSISASATNNGYLGGIAGRASSSISNCYSTGFVSVSSSTANTYAGGIAGRAQSQLRNCYNTGKVVSTSSSSRSAFAGGITGSLSLSSSAYYCYNTGSLSASSTSTAYKGGIAGENDGTITDSFFLNTSASSGAGYGTAGGTSKTSAEMKQVSTFTNWDFVSIWGISAAINDGYPYLQAFDAVGIVIVKHPESQSVEIGKEVTFFTEAVSTQEIKYVWEFSSDGGLTWTAVGSGQTLKFIVTAEKVGLYRCAVSSPPIANPIYTNTAELTSAIPIYTIQDLEKIGNDPAYPMDANYVLMNDISFVSPEAKAYLASKGNYMIRVTPLVGAGYSDVSFKLEYSTDNGSTWQDMTGSVSYFFGKAIKQTSALANGSFSIPGGTSGYDGTESMMLTLGGKFNGNDFAFSMEVPAGSDDSARDSKTSYFLGNFVPIGYDPLYKTSTAFSGSFKGKGHRIIGLETATIMPVANATSHQYAGLFSILSTGASITGVGIDGGSQTSVSLGTSGDYTAYAGGIAGYAQQSASVEGCYNNGTVSSSVFTTNANAGGMIGYSLSPISGCYNTGFIAVSTDDHAFAGGIAGTANAPVEKCYNAGSVHAYAASVSADVGGISGRVSSSTDNCYNAGRIISYALTSSNAGGIAGYAIASSVVSKCYNIGMASATAASNAFEGSIIGWNGGTIADSFFQDSMSSAVGSGSSAGASKKTAAGMKQQSTFANWDFVDVWGISSDINYGYPYLQAFPTAYIVTQPAPETIVEAGKDATLEIVVQSDVVPSYQWMVKLPGSQQWTDVPGATSSQLLLSSVTMDMNGNVYKCRVTVGGFSLLSDEALLSVYQETWEINVEEENGMSYHGYNEIPRDGTEFFFEARLWDGYHTPVVKWNTTNDKSTAKDAVKYPGGTNIYRTGEIIQSDIWIWLEATPGILTVDTSRVTSEVNFTGDSTVIAGQYYYFTAVPKSGTAIPTMKWSVDGGLSWSDVEVVDQSAGQYRTNAPVTKNMMLMITFEWYRVNFQNSYVGLDADKGNSGMVYHGMPYTFQMFVKEGYKNQLAPGSVYYTLVNDPDAQRYPITNAGSLFVTDAAITSEIWIWGAAQPESFTAVSYAGQGAGTALDLGTGAVVGDTVFSFKVQCDPAKKAELKVQWRPAGTTAWRDAVWDGSGPDGSNWYGYNTGTPNVVSDIEIRAFHSSYKVNSSAGVGTYLNIDPEVAGGEEFFFTAGLKTGFNTLKVYYSLTGQDGSWVELQPVTSPSGTNVYKFPGEVYQDIWIKSEHGDGNVTVTPDQRGGTHLGIVQGTTVLRGRDDYGFTAYPLSPVPPDQEFRVMWSVDGTVWTDAVKGVDPNDPTNQNYYLIGQALMSNITVRTEVVAITYKVTSTEGVGTELTANDRVTPGTEDIVFIAKLKPGFGDLKIYWATVEGQWTLITDTPGIIYDEATGVGRIPTALFSGPVWLMTSATPVPLFLQGEIGGSEVDEAVTLKDENDQTIDLTGANTHPLVGGMPFYFKASVDTSVYGSLSVKWRFIGSSDWTDAVYLGSGLYRTDVVAADVQLKITVQKNLYKIYQQPALGSSISGLPVNGIVEHGSSLTFTVNGSGYTPQASYDQVNWDVTITGSGTYTIASVTGEIYIRTVKDMVSVEKLIFLDGSSADPSAEGSVVITPSIPSAGSYSAPAGQVFYVSVQPVPGYKLSSTDPVTAATKATGTDVPLTRIDGTNIWRTASDLNESIVVTVNAERETYGLVKSAELNGTFSFGGTDKISFGKSLDFTVSGFSAPLKVQWSYDQATWFDISNNGTEGSYTVEWGSGTGQVDRTKITQGSLYFRTLQNSYSVSIAYPNGNGDKIDITHDPSIVPGSAYYMMIDVHDGYRIDSSITWTDGTNSGLVVYDQALGMWKLVMQDGTSVPGISDITGAVTISIPISVATYKVLGITEGTGTSVSGVAVNDDVQGTGFTFTVARGSQIPAGAKITVQWSYDRVQWYDASASGDTYTVPAINGDVYIRTYVYALNVYAEQGGETTLTVDRYVIPGDTLWFTAFASKGTLKVQWSYDGMTWNTITGTADGVFKIENVTSDIYIRTSVGSYIIHSEEGEGTSLNVQQTIDAGLYLFLEAFVLQGYGSLRVMYSLDGVTYTVLQPYPGMGNVYRVPFAIMSDIWIKAEAVANTYTATKDQGANTQITFFPDGPSVPIAGGQFFQFEARSLLAPQQGVLSVQWSADGGLSWFNAEKMPGNNDLYRTSQVVSSDIIIKTSISKDIVRVVSEEGPGVKISADSWAQMNQDFVFTVNKLPGFGSLTVEWTYDPSGTWNALTPDADGKCVIGAADMSGDIYIRASAAQGSWTVQKNETNTTVTFDQPGDTAFGGEFFYFRVVSAQGYGTPTVKCTIGSVEMVVEHVSGDLYRTASVIVNDANETITITATAEPKEYMVTFDAAAGTELAASGGKLTATHGQSFVFKAYNTTGSGTLKVEWSKDRITWLPASAGANDEYSTGAADSDIWIRSYIETNTFNADITTYTDPNTTVTGDATAVEGLAYYFMVSVNDGHGLTAGGVRWTTDPSKPFDQWEAAVPLGGGMYRTGNVSADIFIGTQTAAVQFTAHVVNNGGTSTSITDGQAVGHGPLTFTASAGSKVEFSTDGVLWRILTPTSAGAVDTYDVIVSSDIWIRSSASMRNVTLTTDSGAEIIAGDVQVPDGTEYFFQIKLKPGFEILAWNTNPSGIDIDAVDEERGIYKSRSPVTADITIELVTKAATYKGYALQGSGTVLDMGIVPPNGYADVTGGQPFTFTASKNASAIGRLMVEWSYDQVTWMPAKNVSGDTYVTAGSDGTTETSVSGDIYIRTYLNRFNVTYTEGSYVTVTADRYAAASETYYFSVGTSKDLSALEVYLFIGGTWVLQSPRTTLNGVNIYAVDNVQSDIRIRATMRTYDVYVDNGLNEGDFSKGTVITPETLRPDANTFLLFTVAVKENYDPSTLRIEISFNGTDYMVYTGSPIIAGGNVYRTLSEVTSDIWLRAFASLQSSSSHTVTFEIYGGATVTAGGQTDPSSVTVNSGDDLTVSGNFRSGYITAGRSVVTDYSKDGGLTWTAFTGQLSSIDSDMTVRVYLSHYFIDNTTSVIAGTDAETAGGNTQQAFALLVFLASAKPGTSGMLVLKVTDKAGNAVTVNKITDGVWTLPDAITDDMVLITEGIVQNTYTGTLTAYAGTSLAPDAGYDESAAAGGSDFKVDASKIPGYSDGDLAVEWKTAGTDWTPLTGAAGIYTIGNVSGNFEVRSYLTKYKVEVSADPSTNVDVGSGETAAFQYAFFEVTMNTTQGTLMVEWSPDGGTTWYSAYRTGSSGGKQWRTSDPVTSNVIVRAVVANVTFAVDSSDQATGTTITASPFAVAGQDFTFSAARTQGADGIVVQWSYDRITWNTLTGVPAGADDWTYTITADLVTANIWIRAYSDSSDPSYFYNLIHATEGVANADVGFISDTDPPTAADGQYVHFIVKPHAGYTLKSVKWTDGTFRSAPIDAEHLGNGLYRSSAPISGHTEVHVETTDSYEPKNVTIEWDRSAGSFSYSIGGSANRASYAEPFTVPVGFGLTVYASASSGFQIAQWYVNGELVQTGGDTLTIASVDADTLIEVTFDDRGFTLSVDWVRILLILIPIIVMAIIFLLAVVVWRRGREL